MVLEVGSYVQMSPMDRIMMKNDEFIEFFNNFRI